MRLIRRAIGRLADVASELGAQEMVSAARIMRRAVRRGVLPSRDGLINAAQSARYDRTGQGATDEIAMRIPYGELRSTVPRAVYLRSAIARLGWAEARAARLRETLEPLGD